MTDLSKVSVYLRGYFYEPGLKQIEYVGGGIELGRNGGEVKFQIRGFSPLAWQLSTPSFGSIDHPTGTFPSGIDYMPLSNVITATFPQYHTAVGGAAVRAELIEVRSPENNKVLDMIPVRQEGLATGLMNFTMKTIRSKSPVARNFKFGIFPYNNHGWSIVSKPAWVNVSASSGTGDSYITLSFEDNVTGEARGGIIEINDTTTNVVYQIPCVQWSIEHFYAVEDITPGQVKTIEAYAGIIAKNSFDMSVAYYNASTFVLYLRQIGFNISDFAAGTNGIGTLNMKSGLCAGRDFNIRTCEYDGTDDRWRLTLDRLEDSSVGMVFPNLSFPINAGDRFVITDILMPEVYITVAGKKLLAKARIYYEEHSKLKYLYDLEIDSKKVFGDVIYLRPGMYMQISDADLIGENPAYILINTVTITHSENSIPVYKVTLREKLYLPE